MAQLPAMFQLQCKVQQYAWGKPGATSKVAELQMKGEGADIKEEEPYAEYWFGTHPNGPSAVVQQDGACVPLQDFLQANPDVMGVDSADGSLPYLMKVLSVAKALSIQAHPDKPLAEKLHAERPTVYKDGNHKPEMACALTPFEGMCGFRALSEIAAFIAAVPELAAVVDPAASAEVAKGVAEGKSDSEPCCVSALKALFTSLMTVAPEVLDPAVQSLTTRLAGAEAGSLGPADALAARLSLQYPGDVGVFAPYLLNLVTIQPGEAFFMAANEPHAYLSGDCIECMACSDNVVRAGLTPKLRDVDTLTAMLTYRTGRPDMVQGVEVAPGVTAFAPPVPEFAVERVVAGEGEGVVLPPAASASIILIVSGAATGAVEGGPSVPPLAAGGVFLQAAGTTLTLTGTGEGGVLAFRSHTNPGGAQGAAGASA